MALPIKNFHGYIDGKCINDYKKQIDYSIKTLEGRIDKTREILNIEIINGVEFSKDEFWNVIFDQTFDEKLSKDGLYYVEEIDKMLPYKEFIKWCKNNEIDPVEYLEITNPFDDIDYEGEDVTRGTWEYNCQNTSKIKLVLTKDDGLYSHTNICNMLTQMCEYILKKTKNGKKTKYYFYTEEDLRRAENNDDDINNKFKIADEKGMMLFLKDVAANYKFEKRQSIDTENEEDFETPYLQDYMYLLKEGKDILGLLARCDRFFADVNEKESNCEEYSVADLMHKHNVCEEDFDKYNTFNKRRRNLRRLCENIPSDAILTKDCVRGTIYFKSPLRDEGKAEWDLLDMFDKEHVKALIGVKRGNDLQDDLSCVVMDLKNLINETTLTDRQKEILELWQDDKSQTEIGDILGISNKTVYTTMDKIVNNIIKKYEEHYENWYYLNISRGQYKKCSKCGEIKLLQRFNKNARRKDGHENFCNIC